MCGLYARASDCVGEGCDIKPMSAPVIEETNETYQYSSDTDIPVTMVNLVTPDESPYPAGTPMQEMKLISVKPVSADNRAPLWDGTYGNYKQQGYTKTVDWQNGIPVWDDSVSNYKDKDYSDWFLEPLNEIYVVNNFSSDSVKDIYKQNMEEAKATMDRVEELLSPKKPSENLWSNINPAYTPQDLTEVVEVTFGYSDGCPFETKKECEIWRKKPIVRETVSPRSPKIRDEKMDEFINVAIYNKNITANVPEAAPLLERYKMLMSSANACCTDGMAYSLKQAGASDGLVYKFLSDDANFYGLGARCLMITDSELDTKYPNTATAGVIADVRNGCLCRGRQWFKAMLAPFTDIYKAIPEFKDYKFYYTYTDGLGREITVSVNTDVQNVLNQLQQCP